MDSKTKASIEWRKRNPWRRSYDGARSRCKPNMAYGKRGIKCFITLDEVKKLWFRDEAYLMKKPSIDRINGGNYRFENCRFIEMEENRGPKPVAQFAKDGHFMAVYKSASAAGKIFGNKHGQIICDVANNVRRKTYRGYIWKWVEDSKAIVAYFHERIDRC